MNRVIVRHALPLVIALLVFLCFFPVLHNDFVDWDDPRYFTENPHYRGLSGTHLRWMFTTLYMGHYQPLSWLSHGLVFGLWGMEPTGYHAVNLALHVANAVLLYWLIAALLRHLASAPDTLLRSCAAAVGALSFAIHPLRVEAVAWATERQEVLCALFLLLSVLAYLRMTDTPEHTRHRFVWYAVSVSCFAMSLMSKAAGLMLPLVLLLLDFYPLHRFTTAAGVPRLRRSRPVLQEKLPYVVLALAAAGLSLMAKQAALVSVTQHGPLERAMQAVSGLCFYLWKTLVPSGLSPMYVLERMDPAEPVYVVSAVLVVAMTGVALLSSRGHPWLFTTWAAYVVILFPVLGLAQAGGQVVADRYTYLSSLPLAALFAGAVSHVWTIMAQRRCPAAAFYTAAAALAAVLVILGVRTHQHTKIWRNGLTLWDQALRVAPSYYGFNNRGEARRMRGDFKGAIADFNAAIRRKPRAPHAYNNRGLARHALGDVAGAIGDYTAAVLLDPSDGNAYNNRGSARQASGDLIGATADFERAMEVTPRAARERAAFQRNLTTAREQLVEKRRRLRPAD